MDWEFDEGVAQTGEISVVQYLHEDGTGVAYRVVGIDPSTAIGLLTTVLDVLRAEQREQWYQPRQPDEGPPDWLDEEDDFE